MVGHLQLRDRSSGCRSGARRTGGRHGHGPKHRRDHDADHQLCRPPRGRGRSTGHPAPGDPVGVRLPAVGTAASLIRLGIDTDGALQVPPYEKAGWFAKGTRPGEIGPAVIAAHLDSTTGPAVFYRLREMKPGDVVYVDYRNTSVRFVVREARSFEKSEFPTKQVYGPTSNSQLRLVTCDGAFSRRAGSYDSNFIVFADAVPLA